MKKIIAVAAVLLFVLGFTSFTFAQGKKHKTTKAAQENIEIRISRGNVVSVDQTNKQIVVKDSKTGTDRTFVVSEKAIAVVKVGDEVKVKVKSGSNNAESVKVVKSESKKK